MKRLILIALLVTGCAHRAPNVRPEQPKKLEAHVDVLPVAVRVIKMHAYVIDPYMIFPCPSEEWDFPDGTTSTYVADCDPEVLTPYHPGRVYRLRVPPGEFVVRVVFKSSAKILTATGRVDVP